MMQHSEIPPTFDLPEWLKAIVTIAGLAWGWLAPLDQLLCILVVLDVASGLICAAVNGQINSDASYRGMLKKSLMLIVVAMAHALDPYAGNLFHLAEITLSISAGVATFFALNEVISITENAANAGVPIPRILRDALSKVPS